MIVYAEQIDQRRNWRAAHRVWLAMQGPKLLLDFESDRTRMFPMKHSHIGNLEWGGKARKREDAQRGVNAKDARTAIIEGLRETIPTPEEEKADADAARAWDDSVDLYDAYLDSHYEGIDADYYDSPYDDEDMY